MTRDQVLQFAAMRPPLPLPATIQLHPAVQVIDVPEYIATCICRLDSSAPRLRAIATLALRDIVQQIAPPPAPPPPPQWGGDR